MRKLGDAIAKGALAMAGRRSPWGGSENGGSGAEPDGDGTPPSGPDGDPETPPEAPKGPRNPWLPQGETPPRRAAGLDELFRQRGGGNKGSGDRSGGGGGGGFPRLPRRSDGGSWWPAIAGGVALLWVGLTSVHMLGPKEQGIVSTFGKYSRTVGSGFAMTLPWPFQSIRVRDVTSIKLDTIPEGEGEKLMLTSDQNLVDLSYLVRWNIKDLELFTFQLEDPEGTVREVAEAAMRASIAEVPLRDALGGEGRGVVEQNVRLRMQAVLDAYRSGVLIQGVEIKKADPPDKVKTNFQQVTAAQQDAQREQSNAQAWAQQLLARAQGDAAAFDKVYAQYKLAPEVTKRRMYYETMERVLSANDKVVVEANGVTPYLPLPEVKRRAAPEAPASQGAGQ